MRLYPELFRRPHIQATFQSYSDEICMCEKDMESRDHFLRPCSLFLKERQLVMNKTRILTAYLLIKI